MTLVSGQVWQCNIDPDSNSSRSPARFWMSGSARGARGGAPLELTQPPSREGRAPSSLHDAANQVFIHAMNPANETRAERSAEHYIFAVGTYKLLAFTIGTIGVLGFCNNVLVLILYCKFKRLRTPTNLLLVNISLSDLLVSLVGINFTFAACVKGGWTWSKATCVWDGFSNSLFGERNKQYVWHFWISTQTFFDKIVKDECLKYQPPPLPLIACSSLRANISEYEQTALNAKMLKAYMSSSPL